MITDDEIMRLFEQADPARDDGVRMVDAAGYLDALRTRSYDMQLIDTTEAPPKRPRDNRWVLAAIIAAAVMLIVAGAMILSGGNDEEVPSDPPTSVPEILPTLFRAYSVVYPALWAVSRLDLLLPRSSGYMLIAAATRRG